MIKAAFSSEGQAKLIDIPEFNVDDNDVLVDMLYSAISPGTEMMLIRNKTDALLGYSATGIVRQTGSKVTHVLPGQMVACYGIPTHSEKFLGMSNLTVSLPENVSPEEAAFTGLGAIAIHALRQADLRFGETVAVIGLGILGQLIAQISYSSGFRVFGADLLSSRCNCLKNFGINNVFISLEELQENIKLLCNPPGVDCVIICSNTKNVKMIDFGIELVRDRGRILIVGDTDTEFNRNKLFAKEVNIAISRAAGPGRYDKIYEHNGIDYPPGYVRWTEGRNMSEFIRLLTEKRISVGPLITHKFILNNIEKAYQTYIEKPEETMGVLLYMSMDRA